MIERQTKWRATAMLGATAIGIAALFGAGTAANAAPQGYGDIDFTKTGSLTVHKYLHQTGDKEGDISAAPGASDFAGPVKDVVFTAYPLLVGGKDVNLKDPAAWTALKDLVPGTACTAPAGYTADTVSGGIALPKTDATGLATKQLPIGAYMVCETAAPDNVVDRAKPFILTIPMPHETGWVYDVHAYPKNGTGSIGKTIEDQGDLTGLGSIVKFPVTVPIPQSENEWTGFAIRDKLDPRLLPLDQTVPANKMVVLVDDVALTASYYTLTVVGQQVTMQFTAAGLAWLNEAPGNVQQGKTIKVIFTGTVVSLTGGGAIPNEAEFWPNNPDLDINFKPPITSPEVITNWGSLAVQKRSAGTGTDGAGGVTLNGAIFEVYNAVDPYAADCTKAVADGTSPVTVGGKTQFTSEGTGVITIPGLYVSDSVNPTVNAPQRCYVLKEVQAPAGYVTPTEADAFTGVTVKIGQTTVSDNVEIVNTQQEVPELPLTGAAGQVLMIAGGAAALAVVVGLVLMNRRREQAQL